MSINPLGSPVTVAAPHTNLPSTQQAHQGSINNSELPLGNRISYGDRTDGTGPVGTTTIRPGPVGTTTMRPEPRTQ